MSQIVNLAITDDIQCKKDFALEYVGCNDLACADSVHEKLVPVLPRVLRVLSLPKEHYKIGYFTRGMRLQLASVAAVISQSSRSLLDDKWLSG